MIRLLDRTNQGKITKEQFFSLYEPDFKAPEEVRTLPTRMEMKKLWIQCIENNF